MDLYLSWVYRRVNGKQIFYLLPAKECDDKIYVQMTTITKCIRVNYILSCLSSTARKVSFVVFFSLPYFFPLENIIIQWKIIISLFTMVHMALAPESIHYSF